MGSKKRIPIGPHKVKQLKIHWKSGIEMDRMSKFTYPRMRISKRIPVPRYPRMRIFATFLNNTSYYQMGADFVTEYRITQNTNYLTAYCKCTENSLQRRAQTLSCHTSLVTRLTTRESHGATAELSPVTRLTTHSSTWRHH